MDADEREKLAAMGYAVVDDSSDWLGLTDVERQIVDVRVRLGGEIRPRRTEAGLSQAQLAQRIGSDRPNRGSPRPRGPRLASRSI